MRRCRTVTMSTTCMTDIGTRRMATTTTNTDRTGLILGVFAAVAGILLMAGGLLTFFWVFASTMASDGCHGDDMRDICTLAGQQWAVRIPFIAYVAGVLALLVPVPVVLLLRRHPGWVWIGVPLGICAYMAGPAIAERIRSLGIW